MFVLSWNCDNQWLNSWLNAAAVEKKKMIELNRLELSKGKSAMLVGCG